MANLEPHPLEELLHKRIAILDGAMGTMIQRYKLSEADYRGTRFQDWQGKDLKGSLELLLLTKPNVIDEIHAQYLEAGADLIENKHFQRDDDRSPGFSVSGRTEKRPQGCRVFPARSR